MGYLDQYEHIVRAIEQDEEFRRLVMKSWEVNPPDVEIPAGPDDLGYCPIMKEAFSRGRDLIKDICPSLLTASSSDYLNLISEARFRLLPMYYENRL